MDARTVISNAIRTDRYWEGNFNIYFNLACHEFRLALAYHDKTVAELRMQLEMRKREANALTKERDALILKTAHLRAELTRTRAIVEVNK